MAEERTWARQARTLRGCAAAAIAVLLASTGHTLSGGGAPPLWLVVAVVLLAAPLCVALAGRRRSVPRIAASVILAQLALHAAFAATGPDAPMDGMGAVGGFAPAALSHGHHQALVLWVAGSVDPATTTMNAGHALAALLTVVLLAWGERLLAAIARGIRRLLRDAPSFTPSHPHRAPAPWSTRSTVTVPAFLLCVSRRGPPTRLAFRTAS